MDKLREFFIDKNLFNTVFAELDKKLKDIAVSRAFSGKDTVGIKEAKEVLEQLQVEIINKYQEVNNQVEENI